MRRSIITLVVVCASISASAEPDLSPLQRPSRPMREAAQTHYLSGARFFETGQYDAALVEFEAAFRLSGEADFLHNISWTHEKAGRIKEAIEYAVRYQAAVPTGEDQDRARRRVEFLKQRYSTTPAPSEPLAAPSSPASTAAPIATAPTVTPQSAAPVQQTTESRAKVPPLALGLVVGGGALTVAGIGCLAGAWATGQQIGNADLAFGDASSLVDRGRALNTTGIALTVVGGAVVVSGAVSWVILGRRSTARSQTALGYATSH
jgi:tetratricopeptide (TPR) repeat protein